MDDRDGRIALVGEHFDSDDAFRLTGVFGVHWEALDGDGHAEGPEGVSLEEAIAWGRQQARYVSVRLGDSDTFYSAGEGDLNDLDADTEDPDEEPALPWPADGMVVRPRPMGAPPDGSVQEVDWLIESAATNVPEGRDALGRLRVALEGEGRLRDIELTRSGSDLHLRCIIRARGGGPAVMEVHHAFHSVLAEVFPDRRPGGGHSDGDSTWCLGPPRG